MLKFAILVALLLLGSEGRSLTSLPRNQPDLDTISLYIKAVLENLKEEMPNGMPLLGIPPLDPLKVPVIDVPRINEGGADVKLDMKNFKLEGLSTFRVDEAKGDINERSIDLEIFVPYLNGKAEYNLDGKIYIFPLFGKGDAMVQVNDLYIKCKAKVGFPDMKKVQLTDFEADLSFSQSQMHLEGIGGGGNLGELVNTLLNRLGKYVYDRLKGIILPELNRIALSAVNNELARVSLKDIIEGVVPPGPDNTGNAFVDGLMEQLRPMIAADNLDPLSIEEQVTEFSKTILGVTVRGSARIHDGKAEGLSTIHRVGDCRYEVDGPRASLACDLGVNGVSGEFGARAEFMGVGVGATVRFAVSKILVRIQISADLTDGLQPNLDSFRITSVSPVGVWIFGLGPLDWILNPLSNVIVNIVKSQIVEAIEQPIREELKDILANNGVIIPH